MKNKASNTIKIGTSQDKRKADKTIWVNENNFLIDVKNVRIKPGTDWTKSSKNWKGENSWEASATMLYDLRIFGK